MQSMDVGTSVSFYGVCVSRTRIGLCVSYVHVIGSVRRILGILSDACALGYVHGRRMRRIECLRYVEHCLRRERNLRTALFAYDLRKRRKKIRLFRRPYFAWATPPREMLYLYGGVCLT